MFGRKKEKPNSEASALESAKKPAAPKVTLGDDILEKIWDAEERFDISDLDFSNIDEPRILLRGEWRELALYKTTLNIELTDVTFEGHWGGGLIRRDDKWSEKLVATTSLWTKDREPVLRFFESNDTVTEGASTYNFYIAQFRTDVRANGTFGELDHLVSEDRPLEEFYRGSPSKLFRSAAEADSFIDAELMAYSEHRYPPDKPKPDRKQIYCWPEVVQGGENFRNEYRERAGFYGSAINLPDSAYRGVRRAVADFGDRVRVELSVETELYGADVKHYEHTDFPSSASISVLPNSVQITGKLKGVNVRWNEDSRPVSNPSFWSQRASKETI